MPKLLAERVSENSLGGRLTRCRLDRGLTQHDLAEAVGTSQAVIQRIETGKCRHPRNIEGIARVLAVSPAWLMYGVQDVQGLPRDAIETARVWSGLKEPHRSALKDMILKIAAHTEAA
ncbi:MAG: helix-turn-helix transcriptional regulator [Gammaproteobacteria bacterium]|nr:helix-turn-helix transcriptional regulator [Gammaproteobacteria bacterium]